MIFVDDARHWWRMFSVQCMGTSSAIIATYVSLPEKWQDSIPHQWVLGLVGVLMVLGIVGRLSQQTFPGEGDSNGSAQCDPHLGNQTGALATPATANVGQGVGGDASDRPAGK